MADSLITRPSLLVRIRDGQDREAWCEFVRLYAPLVYGFARKRGVGDADAADLVQDVLQQVATSARRFDYDRARGTFRSWLFKVTRNRLNTFRHADREYNRGSGDSAVQALLERQPADNGDADLWDREYKRRLLNVAAQQVRQEFEDASWQAFWQTTYDGKTPQQAAQALKISVGAVYIARSRITARLTTKKSRSISSSPRRSLVTSADWIITRSSKSSARAAWELCSGPSTKSSAASWPSRSWRPRSRPAAPPAGGSCARPAPPRPFATST